ncbi:hypothetical protein XM38_049910 [Halomicronema hongdechloris C2206]|uniref:Uncharacterized protein n=1 Tax=Halomicronema hongdechloris C2206 TaxID=1641165 RepID=A0A1Z3HV52_9CYAN|nr:hypothetical protein [Halomicronema hongdechloris]ASC74017.1 hypothetical protein XM38_049910 [Halomicronema hongdechloris C2206]
MRCAIISRAGQVLAYGRLLIRQEDDGALRLFLETDGGRVLPGGLLSDDGDMTAASAVLADQFFDLWGMSDLTLSIQCGTQGLDSTAALPDSSDIETALL